ncbi:MAG: cyclopropane-fatty-acyl-phospholipid synthase [Caulobacteraceae bacterium]|nr:cyclopropane-fatty-acyl-phospholipid synthase [Caulobacteraceae bacterium]
MTDFALNPNHQSLAAALPDLRRAPRAFRAAVEIAARHWIAGGISFVLPSGREINLGGSEPGPHAQVVVRDYNFIRRVMAAGDIGFAEGYMAGEWDTPDLSAVLGSASLNWDRLARLVEGNGVMRVVNFLRHLLQPNTRRGSRKNIHAHYDLGNAFYARWLDQSMTYSSAVFERPDQPLNEAQANKYRTLARSMGLQAGQSVLEIGCGWGGFAEFAAREVGAQVTGVTISREQFDFARQRLFEQGLADKAQIRLIDYRDVEGQFDRVASIEMFEAVGERYWPTYFNKVREVLAPNGRAGLQIITIRDELFEDYRSRADFIQKYVFPGGMLGSESRLRQVAERAGLQWGEIARFGEHYGQTLAEWGARFQAAWDDIHPLGFDERFRRLWRFYLSYCEAGFRTGRTDVIQLSLARG